MDRPDLDELRRRRDSLIAQIERDFAKVKCIDGISIEDAATEIISTEESVRRKGRKLEAWREVDVAKKDPGGSALSFMDPVAFRYYLPAYMCFVLRDGYRELCGRQWNHSITEFLVYKLEGSSEYCREQYSLLDDAQRTCVARFLAIDAELAAEVYGSTSVIGLRQFWMRYLPADEQADLRERWPQLRE